MLRDAARIAPEQPAVTCGPDQLNYRALLACVAGCAHQLVAMGARGGRVALVMGNSADIAIATYAVQAAGAQVAPLNPGYTAHELAPILADAAPSVVICDAAVTATLDAAENTAGNTVPRIVIGSDGVPGEQRLTRWQHDAVALPEPLPEPEQLSTLQYTGGTTGRAKGVNLSHRAVALNVAQRESVLPTRPDAERVLAITPLFHVYAASMCLYLAAYCRGELVVLPRYRPDLVLDAIARHRITLMSGSPTVFSGLLGFQGVEGADLSSLELCYSGASALPAETMRRWETVAGCNVCEGYGQTEAGPVLTFNPVHGPRKPGSVGIPTAGTEISIVDTETGTRPMPTGTMGEIRARGGQVMQGYRNLPAETADALRDGWLHTGDIGMLDEDGYLFVCDRKKDMVIVGGYNVYPREVEDVLHRHPGVAEAAVIGVPDAYRGEVLHAYVVAARNQVPETDALAAHLAERLVRYKLPARIDVVAALPKTAIGKIDKRALRMGQQA